MDFLGSLSEPFTPNPLAIMPVTSATTASESNASANFSSDPTFAVTPSASTVTNQSFEDPFGDGPFKALPSTDGVPAPPHNIAPLSSFHPSLSQSSELPQPVTQTAGTVNFGDTFTGMSYTSSSNLHAQLPLTNAQFSPQELSTSNQDIDILADILPPSGPSHPVASQTGFPVQATQPAYMSGFPAQAGQPATQSGFPSQPGQAQLHTGFSVQGSYPSQTGFVAQTGQPAPLTSFPTQTAQPTSLTGFPGQTSTALQRGFLVPSAQPAPPSTNIYGNFLQQPGSTAPAAPHMASQITAGPTTHYNNPSLLQQTLPAAPVTSQMAPQTPGGPAAQHNNDFLGNFLPQAQPTAAMTSQPAVLPSTGSLAIVPQQAKAKFEPKSAVWADTLSRGLVNFNISGPKTNPLADIGIDFDAINRKDKRMEKPTTAAMTSTVTMGKAMGSGSGIGRAGAGALRPPPNYMVGSGMGMGMGGGPGAGMGMGGGPGAGMGMGGGPGAGMGMGMGGGPGAGIGGYGGMNQPMGMGMNMPMNVGMGMNMGIGQGGQMQPTGFPPGSTMPGGYNPMMGRGGYAPQQQQQPYGGGYR